MYALASDFDETLFFLNREEKISKSDINQIKLWQSNGQLFGMCTGRPLSGIEDYLDELPDLDFIIVSNGALILNCYHEVIYEKCLKREIVEDIIEKYHNSYQLTIQANGDIYSFDEGVDMPINQIIIKDLNQINPRHYHGISIVTTNEVEAEKLTQELIKKYKFMISIFQNGKYVDIVSNKSSKGEAINFIKEALKIDVVAGIGDSYNDIPLLKACDVSFTFYNSPVFVKKQATYIVSSICESIEKLMSI